jgi:hypothetical protein
MKSLQFWTDPQALVAGAAKRGMPRPPIPAGRRNAPYESSGLPATSI